ILCNPAPKVYRIALTSATVIAPNTMRTMAFVIILYLRTLIELAIDDIAQPNDFHNRVPKRLGDAQSARTTLNPAALAPISKNSAFVGVDLVGIDPLLIDHGVLNIRH